MDGPDDYARALRGRRAPVAARHAEGAGGDRAPPRLLLVALVRALPVLLVSGFLAHLWFLGLEPAWSERARLVAAHERIAADHAALTEVHAELSFASEALEDPLYQERRRRWRYERASARASSEPERDALPADRSELVLALVTHAGVPARPEPADEVVIDVGQDHERRAFGSSDSEAPAARSEADRVTTQTTDGDDAAVDGDFDSDFDDDFAGEDARAARTPLPPQTSRVR